jgi:hypothetical protein
MPGAASDAPALSGKKGWGELLKRREKGRGNNGYVGSQSSEEGSVLGVGPRYRVSHQESTGNPGFNYTGNLFAQNVMRKEPFHWGHGYSRR